MLTYHAICQADPDALPAMLAEVVKMRWRAYLRSWFMPVIGVFGLVVIFWEDALLYRWWVLGGTGLVALLPLFFLIPYQMWKQAGSDVVKEQAQNLQQYVFPYIRSINASPVIDANERYLGLSLCFPSSLTKEIELNPTVWLVLNGASSDGVSLGKITVTWRYVSSLRDVHVPLTEQILNIVRQAVNAGLPVRASLQIDTDDRKCHWQTEEWTTLLLTKLN